MVSEPAQPLDIEVPISFLPYLDLLLKGDPGRNLHIPRDMWVVLAGLVGLNRGVGRMAQMSDSGALYVTESGGGTDMMDASYTQFSPIPPAYFTIFTHTCNPVYVRADNATASLTLTLHKDQLQVPLVVPAGIQLLIPASIDRIDGTFTGPTAPSLQVMGFWSSQQPPITYGKGHGEL